MAAKKQEKRPTAYVVLRSTDPAGPFSVVGNYTAQGQSAAKKLAVIDEQEKETNPESDFFIAVPASSFAPEKPVVKWVITFEGVDGAESSEDADEGDDDAEADDAGDDEAPDGSSDEYEPLVAASPIVDEDGEDDLGPPAEEE